MLLVSALVIAGLLSPSTPFTVRDFLKDGVKGTWDSAPSNGVTLFFCSKDSQILFRELSGLGVFIKVAEPAKWFDALESATTASPQKLHTLVVDWQCPKAEQLLWKASELAIIRSPYRWLILNVTDDEQTRESCQDFAADISGNGSALAEAKTADADVVLVCRGPHSLTIVDIWGPVKPTFLGIWSPKIENRFQGDRSPPAARRIAYGLNGYVFRTTFVITLKNTYKHLDDAVDKHLDFMTKFNYEVWHVVAKMLNSTLQIQFNKDWGYIINGSWTGLIGQQVRREVELGGTPTALTHVRLPVQTFLNYQTPWVGVFMFKEPPMSSIYDLFTQPFPISLWMAIIGVVSVGGLLFYVVLRVERMTTVNNSKIPEVAKEDEQIDLSWSDVVLFTVAAVCQQGFPTEARSYPGRIVTFFLFLGILFFYTSYSASIVALLQSTTSTIHHYKDFLNSHIELGVFNISYNIYYISRETEMYRRRVWLEKLSKHGSRDPFMSLDEGLRRLRSSYFAFFTSRAALYQLIADTFYEHEKCGLREVENFIAVSNPQLTVSKWSTHAEVIRIALRRVQERGIRQRQLQKFMPFKPVCVNKSGNFQSASLIDCYGAFVLLGGGFGLSIFLFVIENVIFYRSNRLSKQNKMAKLNWTVRESTEAVSLPKRIAKAIAICTTKNIYK